MRLGILDFGKQWIGLPAAQRIARTVRLVKEAEDAGFERYWLAEHHTQDSVLLAPEVVLPVLAQSTGRILLGPAGVLLRYYSPLKIAEVYLTMAAVAPGRIELGVCRGPGVTSDRIASALVSGNAAELTDNSFEAKLDELFDLLDSSRDPELRQEAGPYPLGVRPPDIWMLGSSPRSVKQALRHRCPFGLMGLFPAMEAHGPILMTDYLEQGRASLGTRVRGAVALAVVCAPTDEEARRANEDLVRRGSYAGNVVGEPERCLAGLRQFAERYRVEDIVMACPSPDPTHHFCQIDLLANACARVG